jgi:EAL domain-containing protein (putative c-di-GMP-specific phosphodiesterase class I)
LAEVAANQNLVAATNVIIRAATRVGGVDGAAFVVHGDTPNVIASFGEIPVVAGQTFPDRLGAQSHDLGTDRHTYSGGGRMEVIPLPDSAHPKGTIVVSLAPGSKTRCTEAVTSIADLAAIAAPILTPMLDREHALETRRLHYGQMIEDLTFDTVFQPIVDLTTRVPVGYEALTRFADGTRPDLAFADAAAVGLRCALEKSAARTAVVRADALPTKAYVSVNLSASTAVDTDFLEELVSGQREVVVEITEHDAIEDYEQVADALATVRDRARLALDDTGAGYAGLTHLRSLRPDVIKLDRALVRGLHLDPVGRAMVAGLVHFARETGTSLVGEGVETEAELRTLIDLGLTLGQGYLLGVPAPIPGPALLAAA